MLKIWMSTPLWMGLLTAPFSAALWAQQAVEPTLVEFAGDAAVFLSGGQKLLVRQDEKLPGSGARLMHIGRHSVLMLIPRSNGRDPVQVELRRGDLLKVPPDQADEAPAAVAVTVIQKVQSSVETAKPPSPPEAD